MNKTPVLKIILIGNSGVGKTSIINRFMNDSYDPSSVTPTLEHESKVMYMTINGCKVIVRILDTAGMERYNSITTSFYRLSHGVIVVYDVTNLESFQALSSWLGRIREYCEEASVLIIGNKSDRLVGNIVNVKTIQRLADIEKYEFVETSAADGTNITEAFHSILRLILLRTELITEDEEVEIKMLPRPSPSDLDELDSWEEQDEKKRKYKKALENLIKKQLENSEEKVILNTQEQEVQVGNDRGRSCC